MVRERTNEITDTIHAPVPDTHTLTMETQGEMLTVGGDIDLYVAAMFRNKGEEHVRTYANPVIDLSNVPFLDSAGLAALLSIARIARSIEHTLRVVAVGNPRRVLRITGVDRILLIED